MKQSAIDNALKQAVREALNDNEEVTVNSIRAQVEAQHELGAGFFRNDERWKTRSKDIINTAYQFGVQTPRKSPALKRPAPEERSPIRPTKKAKSTTKHIVVTTAHSRRRAQEHSGESDHDHAAAIESAQHVEQEGDAGSESEMSVVIDITPPRKKERRKEESKPSVPRPSKPKIGKANAQASTEDQETIKTLQSQLVRCGVRKFWPRELAGFDSDKGKIDHLRRMLRDVGMTGRFSAAKAAEIKEARELAADLESAREFESNWGSVEDGSKRARRSRPTKPLVDEGDNEDDDSEDVPRGGAHTGLVDFGDSGDSGSD